jgi:hypothetical protein
MWCILCSRSDKWNKMHLKLSGVPSLPRALCGDGCPSRAVEYLLSCKFMHREGFTSNFQPTSLSLDSFGAKHWNAVDSPKKKAFLMLHLMRYKVVFPDIIGSRPTLQNSASMYSLPTASITYCLMGCETFELTDFIAGSDSCRGRLKIESYPCLDFEISVEWIGMRGLLIGPYKELQVLLHVEFYLPAKLFALVFLLVRLMSFKFCCTSISTCSAVHETLSLMQLVQWRSAKLK